MIRRLSEFLDLTLNKPTLTVDLGDRGLYLPRQGSQLLHDGVQLIDTHSDTNDRHG